MEGGLSVAVLIPTFRRPDELARCLAALAAQRRKPDRVLVVARAEDEPTGQVVAASRGLTVERLRVEAPGQIAALNAGLDALREDVVAITDDDCIPRPDWLERIERHFAADPRLGGLGGPDRLAQGGMPVVGARRSVGRVFWYGRFVGLHQLGIGRVRDVELLKGANMSYRREAVGRLRFDTHLRGSGTEQHNDWVFSLAVGAAGWRVAFDPAVVGDHDQAARAVGNPRFAADPSVAAEHAHNQTYAAVRHLPPRRVAAHLLYSALIGTTTSPGVVMTVVNLVSGHEPRSASLLRFRLALRGRADGAATGLRERRRAGGPAASSYPLARGIVRGQHVVRRVRALPAGHGNLPRRPGDVLRALDQREPVDVARAVGEHLARPDAHDALRPRPLAEQLVAGIDRGRAVQPQPPSALEGDEQQPDLGVDEGVPERQVHAVAVVVGEGERALVEHPDEAGVTALVGAARPPVGVGRGQEEHVEALDEGAVAVVDRGADLDL